MNSSDRVVLLTGANGGIGVALTDYLLSQGYRKLALCYNSNLEALLPVLKKYDLSPDNVCFQADLTDETQVAELRTKVESKIGKVWGLVNLAGATSNAMSWKLSAKDFHEVVEANLTTAFLASREFIPAMREAQSGRIINFSSVVAFSAVAGTAHYCASKAGVVGLTKALAAELAGRRITVNSIALGYFEYGMINTIPEALQEQIKAKIPVGRFGSQGELGGLVRYLLSDEGAYMTGQTLHLNGGLYT